ncbi:uncharacterized protein EV422DRAFT_566334 [Fimicolochytrium jonesii]|uniref:uncharacterized protein n=1 Tax=Fimicolochytrium jonesii TaxID=1396493 RepID=UPI0022FEF9CA|nr:uncharacterized protein EV422DRAFT_566334 [Fimicolochytrium jonesii]KAI8822660.1 hypothetical protein EV422DRAFT_566334 [Fimicolochytrium jonesii]
MASKTIRFSPTDRLQEYWRAAKKALAPSAPSETQSDAASSDSSWATDANRKEGMVEEVDDGNMTEEIIVDSEFLAIPSKPLGMNSRSHSFSVNSTTTNTQTETTGHELESAWSQTTGESGFPRSLVFTNSRAIIAVRRYFNLSFEGDDTERTYMKERWYQRKALALLAAGFALVVWILSLAVVNPQPYTTYNKWAAGCTAVITVLLIVAVAANAPQAHPIKWQILLYLMTLCWPTILVVEMRTCGFYHDQTAGVFGGPGCGAKDFSLTIFYAAAFVTTSLFALGQTRLWSGAVVISFLALICAVIVPVRIYYLRAATVYVIYGIFVNYMSYCHERLDRKNFLMRDQLKRQYRATQRARHLEYKAADSKRRFVNYIFHEVRVPLNAASLAVQNLVGEGCFDNVEGEQMDVVNALRGSLGMMAKVLNDVLDFERMQSGKLICAESPLDFHETVRSLLVSAKVVANTRGLKLNIDLDEEIDNLQNRKVITGDEMRLRQVLSNLVSNACKFTNVGGSVTVTTKLLFPTSDIRSGISAPPTSLEESPPVLGSPSECQIEVLDVDAPLEDEGETSAIIRMEVQDTGVGIKKQDMVGNKLFSPYVQTDEGRRQGGKGTGLGLALVRHIVKLSGGRLGVKSRRGQGSIFWVEMPFGLTNERETNSVEYSPPGSEHHHPADDIPMAHIPMLMGSGSDASLTPATPVKKHVQINEGMNMEDGFASSDDSIDIIVSTIPHTDVDAAALRESLRDFSKIYAKKMSEDQRPPHPSLNRVNMVVDSATGQTMGPSVAATTNGIFRASDGARTSTAADERLRAAGMLLNNLETSARSGENTPESEPVEEINGGTGGPPPPNGKLPNGVSHASSSSSHATPTDRAAPTLLKRSLRSKPSSSHPSTGTASPAMSAAPSRRTSNDVIGGIPLSSLTSSSASSTAKPKASVLIVDDDKITRLLMSRLITRLGHSVEIAEDGAIAFAKCDERKRAGGEMYDLVLLDNQMPVMTGVECIKKLREHDISVWACGVTGNAMIEDQNEFYDAGIDRVLTKPVVEADVRDMIDIALHRRDPPVLGRDTWRSATWRSAQMLVPPVAVVGHQAGG